MSSEKCFAFEISQDKDVNVSIFASDEEKWFEFNRFFVL